VRVVRVFAPYRNLERANKKRDSRVYRAKTLTTLTKFLQVPVIATGLQIRNHH
jgi:hypothetical protein